MGWSWLHLSIFWLHPLEPNQIEQCALVVDRHYGAVFAPEQAIPGAESRPDPCWGQYLLAPVSGTGANGELQAVAEGVRHEQIQPYAAREQSLGVAAGQLTTDFLPLIYDRGDAS
jgi:hypothetical protein